MLACEDGARVLSIAMDLARQCRADYDDRLVHLVHKGAMAEQAERSAKRRKRGKGGNVVAFENTEHEA